MQLEQDVISSFIDSLIRYGHIDPKMRSVDELQASINTIIKRVSSGQIKLELVIDHSTDILKLAREYATDMNYEVSCIFYAMWIEHWANSMIHTLCFKAKISSKHKISMIREVPLRGKLSWLLSILGFPTINSKHQQNILKLAELRNAYVHYKWKEVDNAKEQNSKEIIRTIESTIKYIKRLETRFIFKDKKNISKKLLKKNT